VLGYLDDANNARPVPEREDDSPTGNFGLKPHTRLRLQPAQAPVRTIAHYELAHRNTLDDEPQLRSIIDNELLYGLRLVEDDQLLNGDGAGENLLGILRTPGIQRYPGPGLGFGEAGTPVQAGDTLVDAIRRAATRVMLAYYSPTGTVVHPFDWETMELTKDNNGNYVLALNVAVGADKRMWQMPVVASPAMNQGTALTGAFGLGAKIYDRQQSNIRVAEQHADLFIRNAVAILAEQRIGLTVSRPESFVMVDLTEAYDNS
jgi:HK97 family phage major capsid protein